MTQAMKRGDLPPARDKGPMIAWLIKAPARSFSEINYKHCTLTCAYRTSSEN
jgi:hypothetical protein